MWLGSCRPPSHALLRSSSHQPPLALSCIYQGFTRVRSKCVVCIFCSSLLSSRPRSNPTVIGPRITYRSHLEPPNHRDPVAQLLKPTKCVSSRSSKKRSTWCLTASSTAATLAVAHRTPRSADTRAPPSSTNHHAHLHPMSRCPHLSRSRFQRRSPYPSLCNRRLRRCQLLLRHQVITAIAMPAARTTLRFRRAQA
jgi:hypothetical protein